MENIINDYLNNKLDEGQLIFKLDSNQVKSVKKDGVIYTPKNIAEHMIKLANPSPEWNIIEPSCGHGIFLICLIKFMEKKHNLFGGELFDWFVSKVTCVDISENAIFSLKKILKAYFKKHFNVSIDESKLTNIYNGDGLNDYRLKEYDLCIGNPPYVRAKNLDEEYLKKLKTNYISCKKGTIDIYYAFVEKYAKCSKLLVFITPNSFLNNKSGCTLKEMIIDNLIYLIDFKEKKIFKDASVYTSIFKINSESVTKEFLYGNEIEEEKLVSKKIFFNSKKTENSIENVLSGVATLCDSLYIVKKDFDRFYATHNRVRYEIEEGIIVPYLKITKVKADNLQNVDYMIYPYDDKKNIIKEVDLKEKFPLTYKYLLAAKERLEQRDKGKTGKYEAWYAYGRKQGLHQIHEEHIILIPQMIGGKCKPNEINVANLINKYGRIVFTSGFVVPRNIVNNIACDYILSSKFIEFAKSNGKVWPGKDESYYSLTSSQIKKFKV